MFHAVKQSWRRCWRLVADALHILRKDDGDLDDFGRLLHENWQLKKTLSSKVTSPHLEEIYDTAIAAGALGGKLMGAGGSGFFVFYVPPEDGSLSNRRYPSSFVPFSSTTTKLPASLSTAGRLM